MKHVIPLLVAVFTITGSAYGQENKPANTVTPEIIVTGTRIPQPNLESTSPITFKTDQDIKLQGTTEIADLINSLPQNLQNSQIDFSSTSNPLSSPGGISTADLRGLGPQRTLVLVNGRRLGIGDANTGNNNPSPDLNQIPTALVERVDVVTGGASAVYGSDAVAGVVNFILKKNFEGIEADAQYGFNQHTNENGYMRGLLADQGFALPDSDVLDGRNKEFSLIMGTNFDGGKANATAYFTYRSVDSVLQGSRDFSACKFNVGGTNKTVGVCGGTVNSNLFELLTTGDDYTVVGNEFLPWPQAGSDPPGELNTNPFQYLLHPNERYIMGFMAHDEFSEKLDFYTEFNYMNDKSSTGIAPSGLFLGGNAFDPTGNGGYQVNCGNPFLSAGQQTIIGCTDPSDLVTLLIGRRNVEGGGRVSSYEHNNYRFVFGADGDVSGWKYDAYVQYYYTSLYQSNEHYLSNKAIGRALQVVSDPTTGDPVCTSVLDGSDLACVPYNIFQQGGVTPEAVNYLDSIGTQFGSVEQKTLAANVQTDLGRYGAKLPWANSGVAIDAGIEHRVEMLNFRPDQASFSNDLSGFGGASTIIDNKGVHVTEEYIEVNVPIIEDRQFAHDLRFGAAYRHSDYSLAGGVNTYKFDVKYAPIQDFAIRASYNRAIRAPNIIELFNPQTVTNTSVVGTDPCAGATPTASLADCQRTGVTLAQYGSIPQCPADQCSILLGGNLSLKPETADTYSVGATFTPTFLEDFSASIDYFKIDIADEVSAFPVDIRLQRCLDLGDASDCDKIKRTSAGLLFGTTIAGGGYIDGTALNLASATAGGIDVQAQYRYTMPGSLGSLTAQFLGTYALEAKVGLPGTGIPAYDCVGLYGATCQTLNPRWAHTFRLTWNMPWSITTSLFWRYIGEMSLDTNSSQVTLHSGQDDFDAKLASRSYLDFAATWDATGHLKFRMGVKNLFDRDPPIVNSGVAQTGSPNTYPTYDLLGRQFFIGATAKF